MVCDFCYNRDLGQKALTIKHPKRSLRIKGNSHIVIRNNQQQEPMTSTSDFLTQVYDGVLPPLDMYLKAAFYYGR